MWRGKREGERGNSGVWKRWVKASLASSPDAPVADTLTEGLGLPLLACEAGIAVPASRRDVHEGECVAQFAERKSSKGHCGNDEGDDGFWPAIVFSAYHGGVFCLFVCF